MRRPTPLPPPPEGSRAAASDADASSVQDVVAARLLTFPDRAAVGEPADGPAQLVAPGTAADAAGTDVAGTGADAAGTGADAAGSGDPETLGVRDVWRAARARRRALRAEVRRFTQRQRRRRTAWLVAAGAVVLLVAGTVGAAYSPLFAVERVEVVGTTGLDVAAVQEALSGQVGTPLALVDESAVKAALVQFPLVESYTLEARPPHDLVVRIVERTPVGVIESRAGFTLVDAAGVVLSTTPTAPSGQPVLSVEGGTASPAFAAAGQVMRSLPDALRPQVTAVSATSADDVTLTLGATDTRIVWGSAEDSAMKAYVLDALMRSRPPESARLYDVSTPSAAVVG